MEGKLSLIVKNNEGKNIGICTDKNKSVCDVRELYGFDENHMPILAQNRDDECKDILNRFRGQPLVIANERINEYFVQKAAAKKWYE